MVENGYMSRVLGTLKEGEYRQFPLSEVNVQSWRTVVSRENRLAGYKKYSVTQSRVLNIMAVKCNVYE